MDGLPSLAAKPAHSLWPCVTSHHPQDLDCVWCPGPLLVPRTLADSSCKGQGSHVCGPGVTLFVGQGPKGLAA